MSQIAAAVLIAEGIATFYNPGVMEPVVANRVEWGHLEPSPDAVGYVALLDREHVGKVVWLETPDGLLFRVQVADCAARQDRQRLIQLGFAVDLSWELAQALGGLDGPTEGFRVWDQLPAHRQAVH
jgi:hypothetical protein